ncbi:molybdenum cofactor guanylyltransferase [Oxyplasma meridianum]|uniref:Molybdenum cofactor guanylyltransferase n=1 Tax=Oxyplasma meridianum TaxID=3073602 RepID=A0AAX4NDK3_9ARCH
MKATVFVKMSERFPGKHRFLVRGKQIIDYELEKIRLSGCFNEVIVISKDRYLTTKNARIINDTTNGTLINSLLFALEEEMDFMAFAGDMPLVSPEFIRKMCEVYNGRPVVPRWKNGKIEPMMAIYNRTIVQDLKTYINSGKKSLREFILNSDFETIDIPQTKEMEYCFFNVNYPEDLMEVENLL